MGAEQSTLDNKGYKITERKENCVVATKGDEIFLIKMVPLNQIPENAVHAVSSEIETFRTMSHPHIVSGKNSFEDENTWYVVMQFCQGGSLASKIRETPPVNEFEVLSCFVEICLALKTIHEKGFLYKHLKPENVYLTEFGILCLGEFGQMHEISKRAQRTNNLDLEEIKYQPPEFFTDRTYDEKSEIWSLGCILYELCTKVQLFSADNPNNLVPKIIRGSVPALPQDYSPKLCELLQGMVNTDPRLRPTAKEILELPCMIRCLLKKCKNSVQDLQGKLNNLRDVADNLEKVHLSTTAVSLTGGVIGAMGGITSIVGLILAPFTLGASLIVTGVGVGVSVAGGITAGASNITNMVTQSSDRKAVRSIIAELEHKMSAVTTWIGEISNSLQEIQRRCDTAGCPENDTTDEEKMAGLGLRVGKGLGGIAELVRLVSALNIGRIAAQATRAIRVAEVVSGVLSGLFLAFDVFFIAMDAREIHQIRQANSTMDRGTASSEIRSETMKVVLSIRQAADELQEVLNELQLTISAMDGV